MKCPTSSQRLAVYYAEQEKLVGPSLQRSASKPSSDRPAPTRTRCRTLCSSYLHGFRHTPKTDGRLRASKQKMPLLNGLYLFAGKPKGRQPLNARPSWNIGHLLICPLGSIASFGGVCPAPFRRIHLELWTSGGHPPSSRLPACPGSPAGPPTPFFCCGWFFFFFFFGGG